LIRWSRKCRRGIPQPDGVVRIHKTGQASRAALQNYMRAVKRFADFHLEGRVTDDFPPLD
jgi:hypothetical protein